MAVWRLQGLARARVCLLFDRQLHYPTRSIVGLLPVEAMHCPESMSMLVVERKIALPPRPLPGLSMIILWSRRNPET